MKNLLTPVLAAVFSMVGIVSCAAKSTETSNNITDTTKTTEYGKPKPECPLGPG